MTEVPKEAVRAAEKAMEHHLLNGNDTLLARAAVEAAAPLLAEHIAAEILAVDPVEWALAGQRAGQDAARIALEAFPKETRSMTVEITREVVVAAAKASSMHFTACDFGDKWQDCGQCRTAYDRAHYAMQGGLAALAKSGMVVVPVGDVGAVLNEVLGGEGLVIVSAEDLDMWVNRARHATTTWDQLSAALSRLHAALPDGTTDV